MPDEPLELDWVLRTGSATKAQSALADGDADALGVLSRGWLVLAIRASEPADADPARALQAVRSAGTPSPPASGRSGGPRPTRIPRAVRAEIRKLRADVVHGLNDRQIADALNGAGGEKATRHPTRKGDAPWNAAAVRHIVNAIRAENRDFLRRVGELLSAVSASGRSQTVSRGQFIRFCRDFALDPYWIWDQFDIGPDALSLPIDPNGELLRPISLDDERDEVGLSEVGSGLLRVYHALAEIPDSALDVAQAMRVHKDPIENLEGLCRRYHARVQQLVGLALVEPADQPGYFRLTKAGDFAGSQWQFIAEGPTNALKNYWPGPTEEAALPPDWDWSDRPLFSNRKLRVRGLMPD